MNDKEIEFEKFQKYFKRYQELFGLTGYKVYFKHEDIGEGCFASISICIEDMAARVRLNNNIPEKHEPFADTKVSARHEALHLLLYKLESCMKERYISERECDIAIEETVNKLEELIE